MAHVGKYYPRTIRPDMAFIGYDGWVPPRKLFYKATSGGTLGTLAAPWQNIEVLTDVGDNETDRDKITWQIDHPTVPDNYIKAIWTIKHRTNPVPSQRLPDVSWLFEFWHQGTKYGDQELLTTQQIFLGALRLGFQWISWNHLINLALFRQINQSQAYAGTWEQQPEYHPYRHEP